MAVLHRAHTSGFCSALEQLSHSVALLLSLSAGASTARSLALSASTGPSGCSRTFQRPALPSNSKTCPSTSLSRAFAGASGG